MGECREEEDEVDKESIIEEDMAFFDLVIFEVQQYVAVNVIRNLLNAARMEAKVRIDLVSYIDCWSLRFKANYLLHGRGFD